MNCWLITYNPELYPWDERAHAVNLIQNNKKTYEEGWNFSNTHAEIGDRVFLMELGNKGRGLIAAGHVNSKGYDSEHWRPEKAAQGATTNYNRVIFDWIIAEDQKGISLGKLKEIFPGQTWSPNQSGIEIQNEVYKKLEIIWSSFIGAENDIKNVLAIADDIVPDDHDGSYEMARETLSSYLAENKIDEASFADIDLMYMASTIQPSQDRLMLLLAKSVLSKDQQDRLKGIYSKVLTKNLAGGYSNHPKGSTETGMVASGFKTFNRKNPDLELPRKIFRALKLIYSINDEPAIYDEVLKVLPRTVAGIGPASLSIMAHCLKPFEFPICNDNEGHGNVATFLDPSIKKPKNLRDYVLFAKQLNEYKKKHFTFKNFRVLDLAARQITFLKFKVIFDDLVKNGGAAYKDPQSETGEKRNRLLEIKKESQIAQDEFVKVASFVSEELGLPKEKHAKWLNFSGTQVKEYFWAQLQYDEQKDGDAISLSIFANKSLPSIGTPGFRVAIEVNDGHATPEDYEKLKKILDVNLPEGFCYVAGSDQHGDPAIIDQPPESIKEKLRDGVLKKVQLSKLLPYDNREKPYEYLRKIIDASRKLIDVYDYIVGLTDITTTDTPQIGRCKMEMPKNIIFYGPPGTGKTYSTNAYCVSICDNKPISEVLQIDREKINIRYRELLCQNRIKFVTFHQSYTYEDFVIGIFPEMKNGQLSYVNKSGAFKKLCDRAKDEPNKNYVMVIDEINRGNISKVFGELITLIEDSRRQGEKEETQVDLPFEDEKGLSTFSVPPNVYIIGTMNTADRSIQHVDTALRRRFKFIEVGPKPELLMGTKIVSNGKSVGLDKVLSEMNKRIARYYDREHVIGHSYFLPLCDAMSDEERIKRLGEIFHDQIIPLLQDYFFENYGKIQKVLNETEIDDQTKCLVQRESDEDFDEDDDIRPSYVIAHLQEDSPFFDIETYLTIAGL